MWVLTRLQGMLRVVETNDVLEIQAQIPAGQRVLFLLLSFLPLLAPYELIIRPDWHDTWNVYFLFAAFISAGALAVSALLVWAAAAGLSTRLRFDRAHGTLMYSAGAPVLRWHTVRHPIKNIAEFQVEKHDWSDGQPSYSFVTLMADGRSFRGGSSWSRDEVEGIRRMVSSFLGMSSRQ
jgi:hypothetical protein